MAQDQPVGFSSRNGTAVKLLGNTRTGINKHLQQIYKRKIHRDDYHTQARLVVKLVHLGHAEKKHHFSEHIHALGSHVDLGTAQQVSFKTRTSVCGVCAISYIPS